MKFFTLPEYSIRDKVVAVSLWATTGAMLLAFLAFMAGDFLSYRTSLARRLTTIGEIISLNAASTVVFNDSVAAANTLSSLEVHPAMRAAVIYKPNGAVFARWSRTTKDAPPPLPQGMRSQSLFSRNTLTIFYPMVIDKAMIGMVCLVSDLSELKTRIRRYAIIGSIVFIITVLAAGMIAARVGTKITEPVGHLAQVAKVVSEQKDYSVRAQTDSKDEIGLLVKAFNVMLAKIQEDETERRKAADEIKKLNESLEQKVADRTVQLTAANRELEAFSYSVSHDLRTPLRAIDGFSRELLENEKSELDDQAKSDLQRIRAATQRMAQLIDDLLKLSRITRSDMIFEAIDLSGLVKRITQELKAQDEERKIDVTIAPRLSTRGDLQLMRVALENLLGNAWKFTQKAAHAKIEFGEERVNGKKAFFVRDNGAGFDMTHAEKLFGVFQRLHEVREFAGTGIGLATVQRIITRHGGKIWATAEVGKGATFYFTMS